MGSLILRDRDAIVTDDGFIFRVYGYFHPPNAYVCDVEYASSKVFQSEDKRAFRKGKHQIYYKFYVDEGLKFVLQKYPKYTVFYEPLQTRLVGITNDQIGSIRKPDQKFHLLIEKAPENGLLKALQEALNLIMGKSRLSRECFGVFGSLLHDFYHPSFSDLDLIVYGRKNLRELCDLLNELYQETASPFQNEFDDEKAVFGKHWRFLNYSLNEFVWHQRRKMIYALFKSKERPIKMEFEPVKDWQEICNEYDSKMRIVKEGWIKAIARITEDCDAPFMPSIYKIERLKILGNMDVDDIERIVSYVEEFRFQAKKDEIVYVEGNLERVMTPTKSFHQITLTYGSRYYEQVLKVLKQ
jgi:predicted nucleotidyltransferase